MTNVTQHRSQPARQVSPADVMRLFAELKAEPYPVRSRFGATTRMAT